MVVNVVVLSSEDLKEPSGRNAHSSEQHANDTEPDDWRPSVTFTRTAISSGNFSFAWPLDIAPHDAQKKPRQIACGQVPGLAGVAAVVAYDYHACALLPSGTMMSGFPTLKNPLRIA